MMPIIDTKVELNKDLVLTTSGNGEHNLHRANSNDPHSLPGQARSSLTNGPLQAYLREALLVTNLDKIAPYLSFAFTPDYAHISPLHFQATRGRSIIVTEEVHLHLVWYYDRIFIKPLPAYLLSSAFWDYVEKQDAEIWQAAAGLMRTYACLIKFEVDFRKAQSTELGLIPTHDKDPITYERFAQFIAPFAELGDDAVRPRYHYGEMRLTRLNWFARIFLWKLTYHHTHAQWKDYLGRFLAPLLTVFLLLSTALTAMQVELAVQSMPPGSWRWDAFLEMCRWFSIIVLILVAMVIFLMTILVLFMFIHNQAFAQRMLYQKKRNHNKLKSQLKSGVV